jgi:hypothetical protein
MKKTLATASSGSLNWEYIPIIVSKVVNQSITPRTGFRPVEMIFGRGPLSDSFLDLPPLYPTHHLVKDSKEEIEKLTNDLFHMAEIARKTLEESKIETNKVLNKNRLDKSQNFEKGDIVYALDRYNLPGNSRPLKTTFFPSPYIIIETFYTTSLIERLADKFRTLISNNDIKKFKGNPEVVKDLPDEIKTSLLGDFKDLIEDDILKIAKIDPLSIPPGIFLKDNEDLVEKSSQMDYDIEDDDTKHVEGDTGVAEVQDNAIENDEDSDDGDGGEPVAENQKYNMRPRRVRFNR